MADVHGGGAGRLRAALALGADIERRAAAGEYGDLEALAARRDTLLRHGFAECGPAPQIDPALLYALRDSDRRVQAAVKQIRDGIGARLTRARRGRGGTRQYLRHAGAPRDA